MGRRSFLDTGTAPERDHQEFPNPNDPTATRRFSRWLDGVPAAAGRFHPSRAARNDKGHERLGLHGEQRHAQAGCHGKWTARLPPSALPSSPPSQGAPTKKPATKKPSPPAFPVPPRRVFASRPLYSRPTGTCTSWGRVLSTTRTRSRTPSSCPRAAESPVIL